MVKRNLNTILIIVGFTVLILILSTEKAPKSNTKEIESINNNIDSLKVLLKDFDPELLKDSIKHLNNDIQKFTIDSSYYFKYRDSLRSRYNPK